MISECHPLGRNSFEQLCINFINEKIQQFCLRRLIKQELEWYNMEGIGVPEIDFLDNEHILSKSFQYLNNSFCRIVINSHD